MLGWLKYGYFDALLALLRNRVFAINTRERITILHNLPTLECIIF